MSVAFDHTAGAREHGDAAVGGSARRLLVAVLLLPVALSVLAAHLSAQPIEGRVMDVQTNRSIAGAIVEVFVESGERVGAVLSNNAGRFRITTNNLRGPFIIEVSAMGYGRGTWTVRQPTGRDAPRELALVPVPVDLDPLVVTSASGRTPGREWVRRRQVLGAGHYLPGAVLAEINPRSTTEFIADRLGYLVRYSERGEPVLYNPQSCMVFLLNEWPLNQAYTDENGRTEVLGPRTLDEIDLERIAAVEVFDNIADIPPGWLVNVATEFRDVTEFVVLGDGTGVIRRDPIDQGIRGCGLVNIWTWESW